MTDTPIFDRLRKDLHDTFNRSAWINVQSKRNNPTRLLLDWLDEAELRDWENDLQMSVKPRFARGGVVITANKIELSHGEHVMNRTTSSSYGENIILRFL